MSDRVLRFKKLQSALSDRLAAQAMRVDGDLLAIRATDVEQLAAAMQATREHGLKAGDEVLLGVEGFDMVHLVDPHSCLCEVGAHVPLQVLEARLKTSGLTLGSLTPSAMALRVGEWLEGPHASLRPIPGGRLEPGALALEAALWIGRVYRSHRSPRSASGPDLDHLLLGGQGAVGRITRATLRVTPRPTTTELRTVQVPNGATAVTLLQECLAKEAVPVQARIASAGSALALTLRFDGLAFRVHRDGACVARLAEARSLAELPAAAADDLHTEHESEVSWPALAAAIDSVRGQPIELHRIVRESVVCLTERPLELAGAVRLDAGPVETLPWWPSLAALARGES